jgi:signal transduction histidine kinase
MDVLSRITRTLAEAGADPTAVLTAITERVAEALDASCALLRVSDCGRLLVPVTRASPRLMVVPPELVAILDAPVPLGGDALLAKVVRTRRAVTVAAVDEERLVARYPDEHQRAALQRLAPRSLILLPIQVGDAVLGVLALLRHGPSAGPFDAGDVVFAEQFTHHAALALTNARLVADAREDARRLRLLSELTAEFAASVNSVQDLLDLIARRIGDTLADATVLRLVRDGDAGFEAVGAIYTREPSLRALCEPTLAELADTSYGGVAERVASSGAPLFAPEVRAGDLVVGAPPLLTELITRLAPRSLVAVPLVMRGRVTAVVILARGEGWPTFTERDLRFVEQLAAHATIAITNARLLESSTATARRHRALTDAAAMFAADVDEPQRLLDTLAGTLSELIGGLCVVRVVPAAGEPLDPIGAVVHPDPKVVAQARVALAEGRGIAAESLELAMRTGQSRLFRSARHDPPLSALAIPIREGAAVIGALVLVRRRGPPYTVADLSFGQDVVNHAALAIRNSRLLASVHRELSERVRAQTALLSSQEQLRHAQKLEAVGRLAGGVAHDFNNLLSVVLTSCMFLSEAIPPGDPIAEDVEQIRRAGERAANLTKQLLAFSRQQAIEPRVLDLNERVRNVRALLRRLVGEDVALTLMLDRGLGTVKADPSHIEQVLMNLAINARDAMPHGGSLTIETANVELDASYATRHIDVTPGSYVMLAVTDTGEGMSAETLERIYEPFFTTKPSGKGTGLGLSTVFGIVKQNGGSIFAYSEVGKGSTFKVYLPRVDAEVQPAAAPPESALLRGDETILLVEDDDAVRSVARAILTRSGYRVIETRDGREALSAFERHADDIDLVLTDVVMPGIGGRELAERLL